MVDREKLVESAMAELMERNGPDVEAPGSTLSVRGTLWVVAKMIAEAFEQEKSS